MTQRLLYVERTDRGDRLAALRLIGPRTADAWRAEDTSTVDAALAAIREGADWVRERLATGDRGQLASICLDPDGALCSWLTAPSGEPAIIQAVARGVTTSGHEGEDDTGGSMPAARALDHFSSVGAGMTLQALVPVGPATSGENGARGGLFGGKSASDASAPRRRLTVLGVPDSAAGVLIDTLDSLGIPTPPATSLWHAMAQAWDPAAPANTRSDAPRTDRLVADDTPVTAVILIEPQGRLTWAWSRAGVLLTGGSMRLPRTRGDRTPHPDGTRHVEVLPSPRLDPSHAARLAAEWLSWSAQTGAAPARVIVLSPDLEQGLSPAELAGGVVKAWPGATVDLITDDDPVTHTLRRALDADSPQVDAPGAAIIALSSRPGRAHRSMYVWSALAIAGLAAASGTVAVLSWRSAADARARADQKRRATQTLVLEHYADPTAAAAGAILTLQDELDRLQTVDLPADTSEFKPVLQELETIGLVVSSLIASSPESEFRSLTLDNLSGAALTIRFPNVNSFERFRNALSDAGVTELNWTPTSLGTSGSTTNEATFRATWRSARPGGAP